MQTTAAMAGGAASLNNALEATTGFVGNAATTVAQGISHLKPGVVVTDITHVLSDGSRIVTDHATSITSLVKNGETAVIENVLHLIPSEPAISSGHLVPDIAVHTIVDDTSAVTEAVTGATKAAVTENTAKLVHVLDSINPLHPHIISTGSTSKDAQAQVCVILLCMSSCHGCPELLAELSLSGNRRFLQASLWSSITQMVIFRQ
jgi:hypothetical protein